MSSKQPVARKLRFETTEAIKNYVGGRIHTGNCLTDTVLHAFNVIYMTAKRYKISLS